MKKFSVIKLFIFVVLIISFSACGVSTNKTSGNQQTYDIDNSYFEIATYKPRTYTNADIQNRTTTQEYVLTCTSSCSISLIEYTAEVKIYSKQNTLLDSQTIKRMQTINQNEKFSFDVPVSLSVQNAVSLVNVVFSGKSKNKPFETYKKYQITFVYNNGSTNSTIQIEKGKTVATPKDPHKENYLFNGWYTESSFVNKYDFSKEVTKNLTLYAKYEIDATSLTNKISTDLIKGIVKIYNKSYNTFLGIETSSSTSQGSGFCFHIQNGYYYILTNCHVARKNSSYDNQKFTIEDYQGNTYEGFLYKNSDKSGKAINASYDLACLYFKPTSTNVKKLSLCNTNPNKNDDVISLGAPKSQSNSITYGTIYKYEKITLKNTSTSMSNVTFDVISHNAYINNGSSGGPLLNATLEVVGVNYAGDEQGNGWSVPIEKVREFLNSYVYN